MRTPAIIGMWIFVGLFVAPASALIAQDAVRQQVTRAELRALELRLAGTPSDPRLADIRARLSQGDFFEGDRVLIRVVGETALSDTFSVRSGRVLVLPDLPPINVAGVLRSELEAHLRAEISKSLRNPQVSATSLVRVAILGGVVRPGFYQVPAETPLGQTLMLAGGVATNAKVEKTVVRRQGVEAIGAARVRAAFADGLSVDQADMRPGDELFVPSARTGGGLLPIISAVVGIVTAVVIITR